MVGHHRLSIDFVPQSSLTISVYPREAGQDKDDVTSFLEEQVRYNVMPSCSFRLMLCQKNWGGDRANRPDILFQYVRTEHDVGCAADIWILEDRVVLDSRDEPLLDYPEIPWTCSSKMEGWLMEAIVRSNVAIISKDFQQRMPPRNAPTENALSMRRTRFRALAGCLSWREREGTNTFKDYLDELVPLTFLRGNSTKNFRDLTPLEVAAMKKGNLGQYPSRSRKKAEPQPGPSQPLRPRPTTDRPVVESLDSETGSDISTTQSCSEKVSEDGEIQIGNSAYPHSDEK